MSFAFPGVRTAAAARNSLAAKLHSGLVRPAAQSPTTDIVRCFAVLARTNPSTNLLLLGVPRQNDLLFFPNQRNTAIFSFRATVGQTRGVADEKAVKTRMKSVRSIQKVSGENFRSPTSDSSSAVEGSTAKHSKARPLQASLMMKRPSSTTPPP